MMWTARRGQRRSPSFLKPRAKDARNEVYFLMCGGQEEARSKSREYCHGVVAQNFFERDQFHVYIKSVRQKKE